MRYRLALPVMLLPLAGCVVPPPGPYYAPPPYAAQSGDFGYPGYAYNNGSPTLVVEGATWPLIYYGGGWGYWDGYHHWHGAPGSVGHYLDGRHPGGYGYHPYGGGPYGHPVGFHGAVGAYGPHGGAVVRTGTAARAPAPQRHRDDNHH